MFSSKDFIIPFVGLKEGKHRFSFNLGNAFFESFDYGLIDKGIVDVDLLLEKGSTLMVLTFDFSGNVFVECDNCLDELTVAIRGNNRLVVKFGDELSDENEEILILPHNAYEINVMHYLYEYITLSLPSRNVHPDGGCNAEMLDKLKNIQIQETPDDSIDPRWAALKDLKNKS